MDRATRQKLPEQNGQRSALREESEGILGTNGTLKRKAKTWSAKATFLPRITGDRMAFTYHHPVGIWYIGDGGSSGSGLYTAIWRAYSPCCPGWSVQQDNSSPKARRALTAMAEGTATVGEGVCPPRWI